MSQHSFKLSKKGATWFADGTLPSGRPFRIDCGAGSRDRAEGIAELKLRGKLASSKGSQDRWKKWHRERAAGKPASSEAPHAAPPRAPAASSKPSRPSDDELRAKLLNLGGATAPQPLEADEVIPPGDARKDEDPDDPPLDHEGAELIAGLIAKGVTLGVVWVANRPLKKRRPPMKGEPHEWGLENFHDGLEYNLTRLIGKTATLGPTGKMFAGAAVICVSVWMTAEPIDAAAAEQAPPPAPAPTAPSSTSNGHTPAPDATESPTSLAVQVSPLGVFGVEKRTGN
jgi:hypothetical protein